jgi:hypothetical protein
MSFDINKVINDMAQAIRDEVKVNIGDIKEYANKILENEKQSLEELGQARVSGEIDDETFEKELEREKKVVEAELLTIKIMTKALAQKAVNAAIDIFAKAVKLAI